MKPFALLVVVCGCALVQHALCQLQCSSLDVERTGPPESGGSLTFCRNDSLQCCLQDHIDAVTDVARNRLSLGLRLQMRETSLKFNATIASIRNYFENGFAQSFIGALPTVGDFISVDNLTDIAGPVLERFAQNIKTENATEIIQMIAMRFAMAAGRHFGMEGSETAMCVRNAIMNSVNQSDLIALARGLMVVQRAVDTLDRFADFLYRYRMNTEFTFPRDCVRRFIELNFCARCTRRSPPLCSNTCGALFRGCLSPYYTVLNRQFDLIWNVSRQVLRITNNTLQTLFANERNIINTVTAFLQVSSCPGVTLPPVGKRQARQNARAMFIPQARMMELRNLSGRGIAYDDDNGRGPLICRPTDNEMQFCTNNTERGQGNYCAARVDCTSMCRCYDGVRDRMDNSEEFTMNGVDGQDDNPAVDLTESELTEIVTGIGMPARAFVVESSTAFPDGVTVPPPPATDHAATVAAMSLMVLVLAAMVALFF